MDQQQAQSMISIMSQIQNSLAILREMMIAGAGDATAGNQVLSNTKLDTINTTLGTTNAALTTINNSIASINTFNAFRNPVEEELADDHDASLDANFDAVAVLSYHKTVIVQIDAVGLDQADGNLKIQESLNGGTTWIDVAGANVTMAAGASSELISIQDFSGKLLRAVWSNGTNAAGTIDINILAK